MNLKEIAKMLDGREYGDEVSIEAAKILAENGVVAVYGASDDLMEFEGAWMDEFGSCEGGTAYVNSSGLFYSECEDEDCPHALREMEKCKTIKAVWCEPDKGCEWAYETDIPHETFRIVDDGELYCKGIVFYAKDADTKMTNFEAITKSPEVLAEALCQPWKLGVKPCDGKCDDYECSDCPHEYKLFLDWLNGEVE